MKANANPGDALESLQGRSEGPSRERLDRVCPEVSVLPRYATLRFPVRVPGSDPRLPGLPDAESSVPGGEAPAWESPSGGREQVLLAQPNALPASARPPVHACPRGARCRSPPASSRDTPPRTPHPGALRSRLPLTLCRSRPSPQRPPGLRSLAAGVGVGGAGEVGAGRGARRLAAQRQASPGCAPFNAPPRSLRPSRSPPAP